MFYRIGETLTECTAAEALAGPEKYAAVLSPEEWDALREQIGMGMDLPLETEHIAESSVQVNYDSLTGGICLPARGDAQEARGFAFALDERGVVFIDRSGAAEEIIRRIRGAKKVKRPGLERFLYDFLETIIEGDARYLDGFEKLLNGIENGLISGQAERDAVLRVNDIRGELIDLKSWYEQLVDIGQELEENENGFFAEEELRLFRLFTVRAERLRDTVAGLKEYTLQLRDLYQTRMDEKQNRVMTLLTIISSVFFPLSLIAGWYGMNFAWMPELQWQWSYPVLTVLCAGIVIAELIWIRRKMK